MNSFLEFLACLFVTWLAYRFLRLAVADGVRDAIREIDGDGNAPAVATAGDGTKNHETRTKHRGGGNRPNNGQPGGCP